MTPPETAISPQDTRTIRGRGSVDTIHIQSNAPWTKLTDLGGDSISGFKSVAILIERAQIADRMKCRAASWHQYPTNRFAFVAHGSPRGVRFLGIGDAKTEEPPLELGEMIYKVKLPFVGCGRDLAEWMGCYRLHSELMDKHGREKGSNDSDHVLRMQRRAS